MSYLEEYGIPAIDQIDTREITRKIREQGAMRALISTDEENVHELQKSLPIPQ
ncbi:MAG: carbamoyl-phosphate synthase domain-containing protein [Bdellovibrionota bacterium]